VRIGVISHTTAGRGGIERTVELHVAGLRACGHDVVLTAGPAFGSGWLARAGSAAALAFAPTSQLASCDVLLAHYPPAPQVARRANRPYVHFLHHPLRAVYPTQTQRQQMRYRAWSAAGAALARMDRAGVHGAARVVVPSHSVAKEVHRIYGVDPADLPLAVDVELFEPGGGDTNGPLLFVGRPDEPYKRLDIALNVARELDRPLHVVGKASPRPVPGVDVVWRGYLTGPALADCYRVASVLLFPSVQEDFGLVPLEAMACGLPVVGWDDGHGPSTTLNVGSGGVLVPAYDEQGFTNAAKQLLEDPTRYQRLSCAGPVWVREHFSIARHIDGLVDVLDAAARA
jgi:glycosyltransferase involved in cell wall biosynthesis